MGSRSGRRRRWLYISVAGIVVILLVVVFGPMAAAPFVRAKLQAMIAEQLDAKLALGRLTYRFPYGVNVSDAVLRATDAAGRPVELFRARSIELKLARLPIGSGPLLIQSLRVDRPAVRLVRTGAGLLGSHGPTPAPTTAPGAVQSTTKLSQLLELRKFVITDGSIEYEDRTAGGGAPVRWRGLKLNLNLQPQSAADYGFRLQSGDGGVTTLAVEGSFNVDDLILRIAQSAVRVRVDPSAGSSPLPGAIQRVLKAYSISGRLEVSSSGTLALMNPRAGQVATTIRLSGATARLPGAAAPLQDLEATIRCDAGPAPTSARPGQPAKPLLRLTLEHLSARGPSGMAAEVGGGSVIVNSQSGAWGLDDLRLLLRAGSDWRGLPAPLAARLQRLKARGEVVVRITGSGPLSASLQSMDQVQCDVALTPRDFSIQPEGLPERLHDVGPFHMRLADGLASLQTLRAGYAEDVLFLRSATLPLKPLPGLIDCRQLAGAITFSAKTPAKYPPPIARALADARLNGPFFFDGHARIDRGAEAPGVDYRLHISTQRGGILLPRYRLPLETLHMDLVATPQAISIGQFSADVLNGTIACAGRIDLGPEWSYSGNVRLRHVDLQPLAKAVARPGETPPAVSGRVNADATFKGRGLDAATALRALSAEGALEVERGMLFQVPVLSDVARQAHLRDAGTVGEAACLFQLVDRRIHLSDIAIGAPAIGVQGKGSIGLDGTLDLNLIATALSDWDHHLRRDDNAVANVAGSIAGLVQKGLNTVTRELLYRMQVVGTVEQPKVQVVAAPGLGEDGK